MFTPSTFLFCLFFLIAPLYGSEINIPQYIYERDLLINEEVSMRLGSTIQLTPNELKVKDKLNKWRELELSKFEGKPLSSQNFRDVKHIIENSVIFKAFKTMPKGGNLHLHSFGHSKFLIMNGTYRDNCYINLGKSNGITAEGGFIYSSFQPPNFNGAIYKNVQELRKKAPNKAAFDESLYDLVQFKTPNFSVSDKEMWQDFNTRISRVSSLTKYLPVFIAYLKESFKTFYEDNILHLEIRKVYKGIIDSNGKIYSDIEIFTIIYETLDEFNIQNGANLTLQFIVPSGRSGSTNEVFNNMKRTVDLREDGWKDKIVGFDLVDHEDSLNPLIFYLEAFKEISSYTKKNNYSPLPYYFHAGETSDYNSLADRNLFDAILLNTTRIGHGLSFLHHPKLRGMLKERNILVEISPISNQLLRFVKDIRTHPGPSLISEGIPISIATDDPDIYGFDTLAFEYHYVYTAWNIELESLKQITFNNIIYSSLSPDLKVSQLNLHKAKWNDWIKSLL